MISAAVLGVKGWIGRTLAVGSATVANNVGVSKGNGFVGTGVVVAAGGGVFVSGGSGVSDGCRVSVGIGVSNGRRVPVGTEVMDSNGASVAARVGVKLPPGTLFWGLLVDCSTGMGG